ncbi:MAG: phosphoribosylglycinamide formyltransferase [Desulfovibrio sp.]|nr:phosphoribosylglycinamide formyltransferase [Desulfovibrio sp.]
MKVAILASGSGTNAQAIIERARSGVLDADIACVISNHAHARVLERAERAGIATRVFELADYSSRTGLDKAIVAYLREAEADLVVLAGYMLIVGRQFIDAFPGRIMNIHPALLPSFPGMAGIASAYEYGVRLTGVSVHFVAEDVDAGALIIQAALPVLEGESLEDLANRIHALEHRIYPQAIQWFAEGRLSCQGRKVSLAAGAKKQVKPDGDWLVWPPLEEGF